MVVTKAGYSADWSDVHWVAKTVEQRADDSAVRSAVRWAEMTVVHLDG